MYQVYMELTHNGLTQVGYLKESCFDGVKGTVKPPFDLTDKELAEEYKSPLDANNAVRGHLGKINMLYYDRVAVEIRGN